MYFHVTGICSHLVQSCFAFVFSCFLRFAPHVVRNQVLNEGFRCSHIPPWPPFSRSAESTSRTTQNESLALQAISGTCRQHEMVSEFLGWQCWHWCMTKQFEEIAWLQASSTEVRGSFTKASRSFTTAEERESFAATLNHVRLQSARIPTSASPKNEFQRYITPGSQDVYFNRSTPGSPPKDVTVVPNPAKVETLAADEFIQRFALLQVWIHSLDVSHC